MFSRIMARITAARITAHKYFRLLSDEEAHAWLRRRAGKDEAEAKRIVFGYRKGCHCYGVPNSSVSCHILVAPGVTMKGTIPTLGPCVKNFRYLRGWDFPDPATEGCMFSLIPTLLEGSTYKDLCEQRERLAQVRRDLALPEHHLDGFGSVTHLAGAALVYKAMGRDIFAGKSVRTETCGADGFRLRLNWRKGRLHCDDHMDWAKGGFSSIDIGVLACGVEEEKALGR